MADTQGLEGAVVAERMKFCTGQLFTDGDLKGLSDCSHYTCARLMGMGTGSDDVQIQPHTRKPTNDSSPEDDINDFLSSM